MGARVQRIMRKNVVAVFMFKKKIAGKPSAFVTDFDDKQKFKQWFIARKTTIKHIAFTRGEVFNTIEEVEEFKDWIKGLLCIGPTPDFDDEKFNHYLELEDDMAHYEEDEFGKVYTC